MKTALILIVWTIGFTATAVEPMPLKNDSSTKWGWIAFGHGVEDSGVNASEDFFWVSVNWPKSTWGNGIYFKGEGPINVTPFKKISVKVSSQQPSKTKIQIEFLTADNAVLGTDPGNLFSLKDGEETLIEADISQMVPIQAEQEQRAFMPDEDMKKIDRVQIIFIKPEGEEMKNVLKFKDMKLLP